MAKRPSSEILCGIMQMLSVDAAALAPLQAALLIEKDGGSRQAMQEAIRVIRPRGR